GPLAQRESVEAANGRGLTSERRSAAPGAAQGGEEPASRSGVAPPLLPVQARRELGQVAAVGVDGQRREPALHAQLQEERIHHAAEAWPLHGCGLRGHEPAARSSASAVARASCPAPSPASIAASSSARTAASRMRASVYVRPSSTRFPTWTWTSAKAATWGRCFTHSTWWNAASARTRSPSRPAFRPLRPAPLAPAAPRSGAPRAACPCAPGG